MGKCSRIRPESGRLSIEGCGGTLLREPPRFRRRVHVSGDRGRRPPHNPSAKDQEQRVQGVLLARGRGDREDDAPRDGAPDAVRRVGIQSMSHLWIIATQRPSWRSAVHPARLTRCGARNVSWASVRECSPRRRVRQRPARQHHRLCRRWRRRTSSCAGRRSNTAWCLTAVPSSFVPPS